ncbi:MAG TPA: DPP IV N-terminal domain-containing protein [Longimicrobiales bacterium]
MQTGFRLLGLVAAVAAATAAPLAAQQRAGLQPFGSIEEALMSGGILAGRSGPQSVNWINRGQEFSYTRVNPQTRVAEVRRYNPGTLSDELLFDNRALMLPGTTEPLDYQSFDWAADSRHIMFQANFRPIYRRSGLSDFYLYDVQTKALRLAAKDARTAELAPDGSLVGFERGGNMYVYDLSKNAERALTTEGNDSVFNGVHDWVYEEEFGEAQAWKWSPDSRWIAFWQTDERGVPFVQITNYEGHHPTWVRINYPKVGDHNPQVKIGVVDARTGERRWLETGNADDHYIPRVYWTSDPNTLAVVGMNRLQNHLRLYFFNVADGSKRLVMEETSKTWIDVYDFFGGVNDFFTFPEGLREFFWLSDRDGYQHLYRYAYDGKLLKQVTKGPFTVTNVEGIDPATKTVYYVSTEVSPLERHLYSVNFDGGAKRRLTQQPGTHNINMAPGGKTFIDSWSNVGTVRQVELWSTAGKKLATLENNAATTQWLTTHLYSPQFNFSFTTSDGQKLDGYLIRPPAMDSTKKYPVLISIYGGPGSQQVYNSWNSSGWYQYLAQQGYIVAGLNNRGSGNYSSQFMKMVYKDLGHWESNDFAELAKYLARQPWVDGQHIGIQGTSYGGYSTVYSVLKYPDVFALGLANSPVTDMRLYDTIYTERYMGLLEGTDTMAYHNASTLPMAGNLKAHLLLIHSAMDENVHPQNTMQLLTALENAGKDAELRFYPPGAHGAAYNRPSYFLITKQNTNEMCEWLKPPCREANLNAAAQAPASR